MNRATWRAATAGAAVLLAASAGCKSSTGPTPGPVYLSLAGTPSVRAVRVRIVGKQTQIATVGGIGHVFLSTPVGDTISALIVAPPGGSLTGAVAQVTVPDVGTAVGGMSVTLVQAAAADYTLLSTGGYTLTVKSTP
jgi:hypothetical protein